MKRLLLQTLGCSKNTVDSEHVLYALKDSYEIVTSGFADVYLINTCSFIADAKQESIDAVLEAVQAKQDGLCGKVVVFGCLGQRYSDQMPELIPEVDAWFGARDFNPLLEYLGASSALKESGRLLSTPSHYAFLKISEGCDRRCSYCAIPLIRGAHRSVPVEELVEEARCLAARGVKELIVIAQDSTYYGLDLYGKRDLARLLRALSEVDGIEWIRMHYSYPSSFPEDVLDEMAVNPKICPYIDIPLQHSSSKLLKMMHRGVDEAQTRALVEKMRSRVPGVVLRTTMIVGHPGETEEDFQNLLQFVRDARFERLGAFTYSEEEDTYSALHYKDEVPEDVKKERLDTLMAVQEEISYQYNLSRVGTVERVLVDSYDDGVLVCRSRFESPDVDGEILVKPEGCAAGSGVAGDPDVVGCFDKADGSLACDLASESHLDPASLVGSFVNVKIIGADSYDLIAELQ